MFQNNRVCLLIRAALFFALFARGEFQVVDGASGDYVHGLRIGVYGRRTPIVTAAITGVKESPPRWGV